jgi:hypothetical protein
MEDLQYNSDFRRPSTSRRSASFAGERLSKINVTPQQSLEDGKLHTFKIGAKIISYDDKEKIFFTSKPTDQDMKNTACNLCAVVLEK